ncbi:hypothetical protein CEQ90_00665 [Lewinellaceae bacterium SD302]|nr:hypothetical protein CEQ90_00665 [Lewinellaceae bacterium SD302]
MKVYIIPFILFAFLLTNCEDPIDVPSPFEESTVVVDAWLTNTEEVQTIRLNESVDYFAGGESPAISGATITVCRNDGEACFSFAEAAAGVYLWQPQTGETLGSPGDEFELSIATEGRRFSALTQLRRTAIIDSISLEFEEESLRRDEGFYPQVYARDLPGQGDTYWLKAWKNDTLLNRTSELTISYDGTFSAGTNIDGGYFLPPLREIEPLNDDGEPVPFLAGDSLYVEVHSISNIAFNFLEIAERQIENTGLFASPIANARGNIRDEESGELILGIFNVAEVASASILVE